MAYEDVGEIVVADEPTPPLDEIHTIARQLILDAENKVDLGPYPKEVPGAVDRSWLYAEHVLDGAALIEPVTRSRYVTVLLDPEGIQVAVLPFSEDGRFTMPGTASNTEPDIESVPLGETGRFVSVSFFSMSLAEAGVRLEGVESEASSEEIDMLLEAVTHPELAELATSRQAFKYMAIGYKAVKESFDARVKARDDFLDRKSEQALKAPTEQYEVFERREQDLQHRPEAR